MNIECYFRLEKESGMAYDIETGIGTISLAKLSVESNRELINEEYEIICSSMKKALAKTLSIDEKYVTLITKEDYDLEENNEEDFPIIECNLKNKS